VSDDWNAALTPSGLTRPRWLQVRRKLGQKDGKWTREQNQSLLVKMGADADGNVSMSHFVSYFSERLPESDGDFNTTIDDFLECAR